MKPENLFAENADIIRALEDAPPTGSVPLPEHLLFKMERARQEALASRIAQDIPVAPAVTPRTGTRIPLNSTPNRARTTHFTMGKIMQWAAVIAILGLVTALFLPRGNRGGDIATANITLIEPSSLTASTRPDIVWDSQDPEDQKYDVWILPGQGDHLTAPALFKADGVTSPVSFAALQPGKGQTNTSLTSGGDYRVLICLAGAGRMAGVPIPFKVTANAP